MRKALKIALIIVSVIAVITLAGVLLYRFFIGSRIQDGGRMENPDAYRAGKELVEFEWRQNHRNFYSSFSLKFYQENDMPLLTGWFPSQSGSDEVRKSRTDAFSNPIPWQLTWLQWFALQNMLAESDLPEYRKPSSDTADETDSEIRVVWRTDDGSKTQKLSGSHAEALETLFCNIIENAIRYVKTKIRIFLKEDGANYIIVFENDGKPIEQKTMEMLFDKFYKGPKGSFGLGLYIARKIAIFHGGDIWAENVENGVQFHVALKKYAEEEI